VGMIDGARRVRAAPGAHAASQSRSTAMQSENPALRGLAALILFRHYGESFRGQLLRNFTLNPAVDRFVAEKKVLVKIENVDRLLAGYSGLLARFKDERARRLFLFYHFREKQVYMLGESGEKLSLAAFYRIGLFEQSIGRRHDVIALAACRPLILYFRIRLRRIALV